jgi:hypothetical protein
MPAAPSAEFIGHLERISIRVEDIANDVRRFADIMTSLREIPSQLRGITKDFNLVKWQVSILFGAMMSFLVALALKYLIW